MRDENALGRTAEVFDKLSPDAASVLRGLLLHKSLFVGASLLDLAAREEPPSRETLVEITTETLSEMAQTSDRLLEWHAIEPAPERAQSLARAIRIRLIETLILAKEGSTEAYMLAAHAAPTADL